jgi:hypothetical protein
MKFVRKLSTREKENLAFGIEISILSLIGRYLYKFHWIRTIYKYLFGVIIMFSI